MSDEGKDREPLSSEELIRRAREEMSRSSEAGTVEEAAHPIGDDVDDIGLEPDTGSADTLDDALDTAEEHPVVFDRREPEPAADDPPLGTLPHLEPEPPPPPPPPPPPQAGTRRTDHPPRPDWGTPESDPTPSQLDPVQPGTRPSFWSRLGTFRGWIIGRVAAFFLFGQCFGSGTTLDDLNIGDCFEDPGLDEFSTIEPIDCNELHDFELYATVDLGSSSRDYPGALQLDDEMAERCIARFPGYVGRDYETSAYYVEWFTPVEDGWNAGDRSGVCAVNQYDADFNIVRSIGSARNSAR